MQSWGDIHITDTVAHQLENFLGHFFKRNLVDGRRIFKCNPTCLGLYTLLKLPDFTPSIE